jgi:hypothetical protein
MHQQCREVLRDLDAELDSVFLKVPGVSSLGLAEQVMEADLLGAGECARVGGVGEVRGDWMRSI